MKKKSTMSSLFHLFEGEKKTQMRGDSRRWKVYITRLSLTRMRKKRIKVQHSSNQCRGPPPAVTQHFGAFNMNG